jgi:hypothetical protein
MQTYLFQTPVREENKIIQFPGNLNYSATREKSDIMKRH